VELGDYRVEVIPDTEFRLDGGAMFGVVPRVLWERVSPPDESNRITLNCNCLFIDTGKDKILIETGMGEKWSPKELSMYGIERIRPFAGSLEQIAGCKPEDVTIVINTHLHFDHAGGNTVSESGALPAGFVPQFKNARYLVSKNELAHSNSPHERDRASYLPENWHPLIDSKQLDVMPDSYQPVEGLYVEQVRGHSETMQTIRLKREGETLFGFFDMVPTRHHVPPAWIMSYDLYPTETLEFKKKVLPQAVDENWICHFYHDPESPLSRLVELDGKIAAVPTEH
jgi:glyoxylase-like metal-dependent hydrolase (beta-lactamase superfamily II)